MSAFILRETDRDLWAQARAVARAQGLTITQAVEQLLRLWLRTARTDRASGSQAQP